MSERKKGTLVSNAAETSSRMRIDKEAFDLGFKMTWTKSNFSSHWMKNRLECVEELMEVRKRKQSAYYFLKKFGYEKQ